MPLAAGVASSPWRPWAAVCRTVPGDLVNFILTSASVRGVARDRISAVSITIFGHLMAEISHLRILSPVDACAHAPSAMRYRQASCHSCQLRLVTVSDKTYLLR